MNRLEEDIERNILKQLRDTDTSCAPVAPQLRAAQRSAVLQLSEGSEGQAEKKRQKKSSRR